MFEQAKRNGAMVILKWRNVIVSQRQLCPRVYLVNVVVSGMIQVVANAGYKQNQHL